jgi:hypothetical protein
MKAKVSASGSCSRWQEGRGFSQDLLLHAEHPVLAPELGELLALVGRQALATALVDVGLMQPVAKAALGDSEILGDLRDRLRSLTSQLDSAAVELRWMGTGHVDSSPSWVAPNSG